jgi:hypothetical protein
MREGKRKMTKAHKVVDHFNIHDVYGVVEKRDKSKRRSHLGNVVALSGKFDLGKHTVEDFAVLAQTGLGQLQANLVAMPYPYTYAEIELTGDSLIGGWSKGKYAVIIRKADKAMPEIRAFMATIEKSLLTQRQLEVMGSDKEYDFIIDKEYSTKWYINVVKFNGKVVESSDFMVTILTSQKGIAYNAIADPHVILFPKPKKSKEEQESVGQSFLYMMGAIQAIVNSGEKIAILPPEKLNKKRKKNGKTPLYEHNIVTFGGISSSGNIVGADMKRASPRQHWRRGHIRTLPSGEKIAIQAMLINGRGFISKEYVNDNKKEKDDDRTSKVLSVYQVV